MERVDQTAKELDLIAYRPNGAKEIVYGSNIELEPDEDFFNKIKEMIDKSKNIDKICDWYKIKADKIHDKYDIGIIGDVKGTGDLWRSEVDDKIIYALKLFGIDINKDNKVKKLKKCGYIVENDKLIILVGFKRIMRNNKTEITIIENENVRYILVPIEHVIEFIIKRTICYRDVKSKKFMYYYPSMNLIFLLSELDKLKYNKHKAEKNCKDP